MADLSVNPTFEAVDEEGNPTGFTSALYGPPVAPPPPTVNPLQTITPEMNVPSPMFDNPFTFNPLETPMPDISSMQMAQHAVQQNQFNLGIPIGPPVNTLPNQIQDTTTAALNGIAMHGALLGALANQAVTQNDMATLAQNMSIAPPEGYEQAFSAPMSMTDALNATVTAMNPAMTDTSTDTSDTGDTAGNEGGSVGSLGGIGSDAGQSPGATGSEGGEGGEGGGGSE